MQFNKQTLVKGIVALAVILVVVFGYKYAKAEDANIYLRANVGHVWNTTPVLAAAQDIHNTEVSQRYALGYRFKDSPFAVEIGKPNTFSQSLTSGGLANTLYYKDAYDVSVLGYIYEGLYAKVGLMHAKAGRYSNEPISASLAGVVYGTVHYAYGPSYRPLVGVGYDYAISKDLDLNADVYMVQNVGSYTDMNPTVASFGIKAKF